MVLQTLKKRSCKLSADFVSPLINKENNVFKYALGVKGLGFKHHGNHPCNHGSHYGNHHGNYHVNAQKCQVVRLSSSIPWDSGHAEQIFVSMSMLKPNFL